GDQGDGNKLWLALIKSIEEKDKVKLLAKALDYIWKKFIPVVCFCLGNGIFRDWLMHMGFRAANKYTITDLDHLNMEPGHSQRSGACIAKPGTKGSSLFKYVDFPSLAPKREGLQIGEEIDEKEDKQVDKEEDKWVDKDKDKWVDEDKDRQEEEQVESCDTTACLNLCRPFFPLCAGQWDW
ncbi:uncharacterized protein ACA1_079580, partial [Acanthamoeba castellanii str. Neff]